MPADDQPTGFERTEPGDRPAQPHAGLVLGGQYELIELIGTGGMGAVWRAQRLGWNAEVAVKLMTVPDPTSALARERFEREARFAARLRGPHVVQLLDSGIDRATGTPFLVMELLQGESLAARRRRLLVLSPSELASIFDQLERALTLAHSSGIIHRDLKPDNIFLVPNGNDDIVKILDFGVAKSVMPDVGGRPVTAEGKAVGTAWYMSPEQFRGERELDHRVDLWSLACIACECLTGRTPFDARDLPTLDRMHRSPERPVPSKLGSARVPAGFDAWFAKATAADIERRYQSVQDMLVALRPICAAAGGVGHAAADGRAHASTNTSSVAPLSRTTGDGKMPFFRRRRGFVLALGGAASVGIAVNAYLFFGGTRPPPATVVHPLSSSPVTVEPATPVLAPPAPAAPPPPPASDPTAAESPAPATPVTDSQASPAPRPALGPSAPRSDAPPSSSPAAAATSRPESASRTRRVRTTSRTRSVPPQPPAAPTDKEAIGDRTIDTTF
jgi:serine/threonine protein kinase